MQQMQAMNSSETEVIVPSVDESIFTGLAGASITEACDYTIKYIDVTTNSCPWTVTRTYTVTDACGNSASDNQIITVDDTTNPVIVAPNDITIEGCGPNAITAGNAGFAYSTSLVTLSSGDVVTLLGLTGASITEACGYTVTYSDVSNGSCPWVVTRTYTITDDCGNSSTDTQVITIQDTTPPTWTTGAPIADQTYTVSGSDCEATVPF